MMIGNALLPTPCSTPEGRTSSRYNGPMRRCLVILAALMGPDTVPFDPHPLNGSQVERLNSVEDLAPTVDASGFYALLENAADGSDKEAGAVVPDYDSVRRDPAAWRGTRCLIEGTLHMVVEPKLSRLGWERVRGAVVRVDHTRAEPEPRDFVLVYLTDPPAWPWKDQTRSETWPERVRLVGRFYALSQFDTQRAGSKAYAVFVAHGLRFLQPATPPPQSSMSIALYVVLGAALVAYIAWRFVLSRGSAGRPKMHEYIEQRRRQRGEPGPDRDGAESGDAGLPPDPIEALDALSEDHERPGP
jgi:hypothetical protein